MAVKKIVPGKFDKYGFPKMETLWDCSEVDRLLQHLYSHNYEVVTLEEGCLGFGRIVALPPEEDCYKFLIEEVALNEWSSAHRITKRRRFAKKVEAEIEAAMEA